ncbi:MAG: hypothetical protein ACE366_30630 [Bradymonadia bacterium]
MPSTTRKSTNKKTAATELSIRLWGGVFHSDNRGFYSSLEFLALVGGHPDDEEVMPGPDENGHIRVTAPGYLAARRMAFDDFEQGELQALDEVIDDDVRAPVKELLRGLKVHIPNTGRAGTSWSGSHFVPYGKGLVHWDARHKGKRPIKERIYYRGAGTLAYAIICSDPNEQRLNETRAAFREIFERDHFTGMLLNVFDKHEHKVYEARNGCKGQTVNTEINDTLAKKVIEWRRGRPGQEGGDHWEELLRHCVHSIVTSKRAPQVVRLDALFHIIPLCLTVLMIGRAKAKVETADSSGADTAQLGFDLEAKKHQVVIDCSPAGNRRNEVRGAAHRSFVNINKMLLAALQEVNNDPDQNVPRRNLKQFVAWFTRGAPAIGLSNALKGSRRFVLSEPLLEALVLATGQDEMTFESFVEDWLYKQFGFVIDEAAARECKLDREANLSLFEENTQHLSDTLNGLGLMQSYSDSTRMVRYEA